VEPFSKMEQLKYLSVTIWNVATFNVPCSEFCSVLVQVVGSVPFLEEIDLKFTCPENNLMGFHTFLKMYALMYPEKRLTLKSCRFVK